MSKVERALSNSKPIATILYVHSSDEMYGADKILLQLIEGLNTSRFRPIVVVPTDIQYDGLLRQALYKRGIKVIRLNTAIIRRKYLTPLGMVGYLTRFMFSTVSLIALINKESVDLVHSNTLAVIPGAIAARLTGKPHIWHVHEIITHPKVLWRLTSWLLPRFSHRGVAVSEPTLHHLCAGDKKNEYHCIVIHNGIDIAPFTNSNNKAEKIREEWGILPDQPLVGMIGRISSWKGQDYFIEIAKLVHDTHPKARFVIVGGTVPGQEQLKMELQKQIRDLGLDSIVILSDFRSDIPAVLAALNMFILPSTQPDPFPTVVLEAMAAQRPVVANAHGGTIEMVEDLVTGFLIQPGAKGKMADAIRWLCDHPNESLAMGKNGRQRLESLFTVGEFNRQWSELYESLLRKGNNYLS
jgi:glycosyltransferase involved in cell wall biosynthesis